MKPTVFLLIPKTSASLTRHRKILTAAFIQSQYAFVHLCDLGVVCLPYILILYYCLTGFTQLMAQATNSSLMSLFMSIQSTVIWLRALLSTFLTGGVSMSRGRLS